MRFRGLLNVTSAMTLVTLASLSVVAHAATDTDSAATSTDSDSDGAIVVTGVRGSVEKAAEKKRKAKQIVDSVVAEDVGKLPDNNVPEAIARVTGVQITREHGEGAEVLIRGMAEISTTVNGFSSTSGVDRSMNLSDVPAELIKSVEVYKTRTADQIEGGIGGTVNIQLRRPLDLDTGLTVAGSFREVFSSIGNTKSPYASVLVGDHFDTGIGEMGFLINASYTRNHYNEVFAESESPGLFTSGSTEYASVDESIRDTALAPYAVNYGVEEGRITRPSINAVWQWQATPELDFVVEGTYFSSREKRSRDRLHATVRGYNLGEVSDLSYTDNGDTQTIDALTLTGDSLDVRPQSYYEKVNSHSYNGNFEAHWHGDHTQINFATQYNRSTREYYGILTTYNIDTLDSAYVNFNSPIGDGRGSTITFNDGVDLSDVSQYSLYNVHDERGYERSRNFAAQLDLTQDLTDEGLFRSLQIGARYSNRKISYRYGYRDSFPVVDGDSVSLTDLGYDYTTTSPDIAGSPSWYHLTGSSLMSNFASMREWLTGTAVTGDWSTKYPSLDLGTGYASLEKTFAAYGQLNYAFDIGLPVDGTIGARVVNTWGTSSSASYAYDDDWNQTISESAGSGNYLDFLPSVNAIVHFNDKTQLRLAWTKNVQRVDFYALSPYRIVQSANSTVYAGNPDLNAYTENSFDASLEYYFGRAGSLSLAAYLKKPKGYIYYSVATEYVPELGTDGQVWTNRNAGGGTFQGFEVAGQTFFDFLPGFWSNFGVAANLTWLRKGKIEYPDGDDDNAIGMSKLTYNATLYYDSSKFSARLAWNYRSRYRTAVWSDYPEYSPYVDATSRLDAAVNFTPVKFLTLSVEGTNLLKNNQQSWWGKDRLVPLGVRLQARTIQTSARFRF